MKCDYTQSNHNWLMSQKKVVQSIRVLSVYWMLSTRWVGCVYGKKKSIIIKLLITLLIIKCFLNN